MTTPVDRCDTKQKQTQKQKISCCARDLDGGVSKGCPMYVVPLDHALWVASLPTALWTAQSMVWRCGS